MDVIFENIFYNITTFEEQPCYMDYGQCMDSGNICSFTLPVITKSSNPYISTKYLKIFLINKTDIKIIKNSINNLIHHAEKCKHSNTKILC